MEEGEGGWGVGLNNQVLAQLDCCLVSDDWEGNFHGVLQYLLPRPVLDHAPILLNLGGGGVEALLFLGLRICGSRRKVLRS